MRTGETRTAIADFDRALEIDAGYYRAHHLRGLAREMEGDDTAPEVLTLHTKAGLIDRRYLFVGSLNLDPRSLDINTEMGVIVHSPGLAELMAERVDDQLGAQTWRVTLDERNSLRWSAPIDGVEVVKHSEPEVGLFRKLRAILSSIVPDSQL